MWISEQFHSIQGEGKFAGEPSVFVRTSGCNLRCWFCDTPYTSWNPEGDHKPWENIRDEVLAIDCEHVVITGGEPLLQSDVVPLSESLAAAGRVLTFETAGTVFLPVTASLMSISPKLENSIPTSDRMMANAADWSSTWEQKHNQRREQLEVVRRMLAKYTCQLKFVIDRPEDLDEVLAYLTRLDAADPEQIWLMPQARSKAELQEKEPWLQTLAEQHRFHRSPRIHVERWGNTRGV